MLVKVYGSAISGISAITITVEVCIDLGVQFWGSPEIYMKGANGEEKLEKTDLSGEGSKALEIMSKVTVCPMMSLRIVGRIL